MAASISALKAWLGGPWQETWPRLSDVPAQLMGLSSGLQPGQPATFCLVQVTLENSLESLNVYVDGAVLSNVFTPKRCVI